MIPRAKKAGVTIAAASDDYIDAQLPMGEWSIHNLLGYRREGLSIPEILKAATISAAKHLRWQNEIGGLKKGLLLISLRLVAILIRISIRLNAMCNEEWESL